ncbi:hypothetical protein PLESTF_000334100 [Pleodorina starrii]|nr:hypothetical protein PLESTF_000334100 [Pleodorina starrii]
MQKDMVPAEAVKKSELERRLAPVVAGQELASAVIQDTVKYLDIQATGISRLNGPYLQVRPAGNNASDILLVGSWRAHFPPGGDGSGPVLDSLTTVLPKPSQTALLGQAPGNNAAPRAAAGAHPNLLTTPAAAAAAAASASSGDRALVDPKGQQRQGGGAAQVAAQAGGGGSPETMNLEYQARHHPGPVHGATQPLSLAGDRKGPIIEEYHSDSEAGAPEGAASDSPQQQHQQHHHGHHVHGHRHHHCRGQQGTAPGAQLTAPMEADPDRMMEDASAPQQAQPQEGGDQRPLSVNRVPWGDKQGVLEGSPGGSGRYANVQGPGLAMAGALASAAASRAAAAGSPRAGAIVPIVGSVLLSPRPRSEWELDPSKIAIGRRLAVGGFGEVFLAKYEGTLVAVKRLLATDSDTARRFVDEVHMLARLRHPNLLLFMGYTLTPEPSIVTEFMARGSLFHILRQAGNRPPELRMQRAVAMAVARGMAYLHSRMPPILHLDLKSPNVLVDDRWRVKIADFGLSRVRQRTYVSSGAAAGSPEWMAPEVLRCDHYAEAADVYSYGVILWELLTGQAPWADLNAMQVVGAVGFARRSLPDPAEGDAVLLRLCKACRAFEPSQRPTFAQVVESLESHLQPLAPPAVGSGPPAIAGQEAAAGFPPARTDAGKLPLPPMPAPPEPTAAAPPPEGTLQAAGNPTGAADGRGGFATSAPLTVADASAATRITRRHSLAASPDANDLLATAVGPVGGSGGSFTMGGGPPRLDARFASVHESPRSRRRYRSPRGEDMVGPPAITARLQDGRKTPSPRTSGGWWQGASEAREEQQQPAAQPQPQGPESGGPGVRLMPANASPFAAVAATDFGPESIRSLRKLHVDSVGGNAPVSDGGGVGNGTRDAIVDGVATAEPHPMDLGSPPARSVPPQLFSNGTPDALPLPRETAPEVPTSSAPADVKGGAGAAAAASAMPQDSGQSSPALGGQPQGQAQDSSPHDHPQEFIQHRHQEQAQPLDNRHQVPWQAEQQQPRQTEQQWEMQSATVLEQHSQKAQQQQYHHQQQQQLQEQQHQPDQVPGSASLGRQVQPGRLHGRPGHRRVNSDEASRLQYLHAAGNVSTATGVSGMAGAIGPSPQAQHPQPQQRVLGAVATGGPAPAAGAAGGVSSGGMAPPQFRRGRSLARNSAPMRYTYGGSSSGTVAALQLHQLQSPPRPRSIHGPVYVPTMHQQVLTANAEAAMGAVAHGAYQQPHLGATTPATPGGGSSGLASGAAALSLSPASDGTGLVSDAGGPRLAELRDRDLAAAGAAGGADPWPDTHSELSFAFILRDNVSVCSDDYIQCASLDRLPLLEESELTDPAGDDSVAAGEDDVGPQSEADAVAAAMAPSGGAEEFAAGPKAEADFELPCPFLHAGQPQQAQQLSGAKPLSPFAVEACARPPPAAPQENTPAPEADLWAALQSHSSGGLGRGSSGHHLGSQPNGGTGSPHQQHRVSGGDGSNAGCDAMQTGGSLPHSRQSSDSSRGSGQLDPSPRTDGDQAPKTHPRLPNGGGTTTYRSGRFKVTIEPACSDPPPPPLQHALPQPNQHLQQPFPAGDDQQLQQFQSLPQARHDAAAVPAGCCADCGIGEAADAGAGGCAPAAAWLPVSASLPVNGALSAAAPALPDAMSTEQAAAGPAAPNGGAGAGAGGNGGNASGLASPHGTGAAPTAVVTPLGESPSGASGRLRNGHHSHGNLHGELSGGPPVALNSVTMYRKGRFFVSHAAAGTHSLSVINPNAASACPAAGCGGGACTGAGGSGGASRAESLAEESEEHDAASGPTSPFACVTAAAVPFGRAGSQNGMMEGGAPSAPQAAKPSWAAVVAMGTAQDTPRQGPMSRQYSRGRFTVAESIVAAPTVDPRRTSSGSAGGDPPATAADLVWAQKPPCAAAAGVSAASSPQGSLAAALPPAFAGQDDSRSGGSVLKSQQQASLQAPMPALPRLAHLHVSRLQTASSCPDVGSAPAGGSGSGGSGCGGSGPHTAPASPKAENVVVRRVGRFTVREMEGGSNASSRGNSNSGTPVDAHPRADLQSAGQATTGVPQGRGGSAGGAAAGHVHGSPPEEGMVPSSHHSSSCSFASASGFSRSSSASHGLDGDLMQPPAGAALLPQAHGLQQPGSEPHTLKVLRVKSKGRFTVIDYEASPPPPPQPNLQLEQPEELQPAAPSLPIAQQQGEGGCGVAGPAVMGLPLPGWFNGAASPLPQPQSGAAAAAAVEAPPYAARPALAADQLAERAALQQAAGTLPDPQRGVVTGEGAADVGTPHGGVLHPPTANLPAAAASGGAGVQWAGMSAAGEVRGQVPVSWGMAGPQAPEQRAQLQADMERLVRERMERNALEQRQRQERGHGGRHRLGRVALCQPAQAGPPGPQQREGREGDWDAAAGGDEDDLGNRCTYEVSFGDRLTIQISHGLQAGEDMAEEGEGGEDEDAVMVDVGIVHGDIGEGGESDSDSEAEGQRGEGREGEGSDDGLQPLQPPETPVHEPVHEREPASWDPAGDGADGVRRRRRRQQRRRGGYGSDGSSDYEDSMEF